MTTPRALGYPLWYGKIAHGKEDIMNIFLRTARKLDPPGYPWYVRVLDWLGGWWTKLRS